MESPNFYTGLASPIDTMNLNLTFENLKSPTNALLTKGAHSTKNSLAPDGHSRVVSFSTKAATTNFQSTISGVRRGRGSSKQSITNAGGTPGSMSTIAEQKQRIKSANIGSRKPSVTTRANAQFSGGTLIN